MSAIPIIYREESDRWIRGDRHIRPAVRALLRGAPVRRSGMQKVVDNFVMGLERLGIEYRLKPGSRHLRRAEKVISFGLGLRGLQGVNPDTAVVAAIGFPHPREIPALCEQYNIAKFLQHSEWVLNLARSANLYPDHIFDLWAAGIDTDEWSPGEPSAKRSEVLIYEKILWDRDVWNQKLVLPIKQHLADKGIASSEIAYGRYSPADFKKALCRCQAMIFLRSHESQGLAVQECLSCNVPVFAWNPGYWMDPERLKYDREHVPATSVPFFDSRCGDTFADFDEFEHKFDRFHEAAMAMSFSPRSYILENLTIERSTRRLLEIYNSV